MLRRSPLCLVPCLVAALAAQEPASRPATVQAPPAQATDRSGLEGLIDQATGIAHSLDTTITVNGERIDPLEVSRSALYAVGAKQLQAKLLEFLIDEQIEQSIASGARKAQEFEVLEAEVKKRIQEAKDAFKKQSPNKDFWTELAKTGRTRAELLTETRTTVLFDKVFFPGIPKNWPDISKEAIIASGGDQGSAFFKRLEETVKEGQQVPAIFLQICRQWVVAKLKEWSDVKYATDGLPPSVCLQVGKRQWKTRDAAKALALKLKPVDRERALVQIVLLTALRQELEKKGFWLSDADYAKAFAAYRKPFDDTPFRLDIIALQFKGYPSFETYKHRWRVERSFEKMIGTEINDESLAKFLERANAFLSDGKVSANVIRIPAFDDATGHWRENGFALAEKEARALWGKLEKREIAFEDAMAKHAKWPDNDKDQGFLANKSLNELRQSFREFEYTDLIAGYSIGDTLFYDVEVGAVAGPFKGSDGYYIAKLVDRSPPVGTLDLKDKNRRDLVKQDYVSHRFVEWANKVAKTVDVR